MSISVVILAAGKGTRMNSKYPKVLHKIADKPMVQHLIDTVKDMGVENIHLVYGHGADYLKAAVNEDNLNWVEQAKQLGTGHALRMAAPYFKKGERIVMLYGDVPLLSKNTLKRLLNAQPPGGIGLLSVFLDDPTGYGRIKREYGLVSGIVEHKDASPEEHRIHEVNTGIMIANADDLLEWLPQLSNNNAQNEYYATDLIGLAYKAGRVINTVQPENPSEVEGVNNRLQLGRLERQYQLMKAEQLQMQGVAIRDAQRFDLRGELSCGMDVTIDINCIFEGKVTLGDDVTIGANCIIKDAVIEQGTEIRANSVIEGARIGPNAVVGPFARVRPNSVIQQNVQIGNFVEVKNSTIANNSKANHLAYIGDAKVGKGVNIGAGVITCNYDGANKHQTIIEDDVFVGSDVQLVAPVTLGRGSTIGAGSTVTKDVAAGELAVARAEQKQIQNWQRPKK